jgi:hypothetical protein
LPDQKQFMAFGHYLQVGEGAEGEDDEDEGPSEVEQLQDSLEKLLKAQQKLVEGQVKAGPRQMLPATT